MHKIFYFDLNSSGETPTFPQAIDSIPFSFKKFDNKLTKVVLPFVPVTPIKVPLNSFENKSISVITLFSGNSLSNL